MLKKIGLPLFALAAAVILILPPQASAAVRLGVYVGGPVYAYPAYPAYPPPVCYNAFSVYPAYSCPAPVYIYRYPYRRGHEYRAFREHRRPQWHAHQRRPYRR